MQEQQSPSVGLWRSERRVPGPGGGAAECVSAPLLLELEQSCPSRVTQRELSRFKKSWSNSANLNQTGERLKEITTV